MNTGLLSSFLAPAAACAIMACAHGGQTTQHNEGTTEAAPTAQASTVNEGTTEAAPTVQDSGGANELTTEVAFTAQDSGGANPAAAGQIVTKPEGCEVQILANGQHCPGTFACLFQNRNQRGFGVAVKSGCSIPHLSTVPCKGCTNGEHGTTGTFNDQMSSWDNETGRSYCWWVDSVPTNDLPTAGEVHLMANGVSQDVHSDENDRASAFGPCP